MTDMRRWLAAALALILLWTLPGLAENPLDWFKEALSEPEGWDDWQTDPTPAPSADPEPTLPALTLAPEAGALAPCALKDDGLLKVLLRSLDAPQSLDLTLAGIYAVEGDRGFCFERDTRLTLRQQDGEVWLEVGGLQLDMGPALTLTRHLDGWGEAGGLYIAQSEKPNLYCGDLSVAAGENGLQVILTIHIEEYLKGVVAYEMSDSFPLEALKAQAVAARTYALRRKWAAGNRAYHLVDTTADQVYKGYDPEYTNVAAAVDATRGAVGVHDGTFASCYYTASNGGQTALAGQLLGDAAADAYLDQRADPYDLENPRSLENDLTFTARCDGSIKLKRMLTDALQPVMAEAGFGEDQWQFDSIVDIEPVEPRFPDSLLYDKLAFVLRVQVAESALATPSPAPSDTPDPSATLAQTEMAEAPEPEKWVSAAETYRVTLDIFDDIKEGLSLGLNGADCELTSVERVDGVDGGNAFRLVMRRFGHGVGMSQRGAQQMAAAHDMDYLEILKFYYPGVSIQAMTWPDSPLTALSEDGEALGASRPRPTPLPTPVPLPPLKDGERLATVASNTLNLRENPTTAARVVEILEKNRSVIVSDDPDPDGWVPIHTGDAEGYVKAEYLE